MYKDYSGINTYVTDIAAIKQSIKNILSTPRGSVPGRPEFGSDVYNVLFSQLDHLTESIASNYVKEALTEFEDRIEISSVDFTSSPEYNRLIIDIYFSYVDEVTAETVEDSTAVSLSL